MPPGVAHAKFRRTNRQENGVENSTGACTAALGRERRMLFSVGAGSGRAPGLCARPPA